jgi:putative tryptophan/tyrosine transport system substrate-binding protein
VCGALVEADIEGQASVAAFQQRLQELGWTIGRNILIDIRWAGGEPHKARTFAKELVSASPDLIVPTTLQIKKVVQIPWIYQILARGETIRV